MRKSKVMRSNMMSGMQSYKGTVRMSMKDRTNDMSIDQMSIGRPSIKAIKDLEKSFQNRRFSSDQVSKKTKQKNSNTGILSVGILGDESDNFDVQSSPLKNYPYEHSIHSSRKSIMPENLNIQN